MTAKVLFTTLALALSPSLAFAMCESKHEQVVQCGQGEVRDAKSGQCTKPVHS